MNVPEGANVALNLNVQGYLDDAYKICEKCYAPPYCATCQRPFMHRRVACQTFPSVLIASPLLYVHLVTNENKTGPLTKTPIQFNVVIQGYSAILAQLRVLCNPKIPWTNDAWDQAAVPRRTFVASIFDPAYTQYREHDVPDALRQEDHNVGRNLLLKAYQRLICKALVATRVVSYEEFNRAYAQISAGLEIENDVVFVVTANDAIIVD